MSRSPSYTKSIKQLKGGKINLRLKPVDLIKTKNDSNTNIPRDKKNMFQG